MTPDISAYLEKRLSALDKFLLGKEEAIVDVEIGRTSKHHQSGDIFRAEINVHVGTKGFRAVSETSDLLASIDEAKDEMLGELRSDKGKSMHLIRRGGQKVKALIKGLPWWKNQ
jgi:ribosomal subunit interface protein